MQHKLKNKKVKFYRWGAITFGVETKVGGILT